MVGNIPNYSALDLYRSIFYLRNPISRAELSKRLGLGEGTIRTILDSLKKKKLIDSNREGHFLSKKGILLLERIARFMEPPKTVRMEIFPKFREKGVVLRNVKKKMADYKVRDIAVRNGAEGALILKYDKRLEIEGYSKADFSSLEREFSLKPKDTLIIAFAESYRDAENACVACALFLTKLKDLLGKNI